MRNRLIELLEAECGFSRYMTDDERRAKLADHLLAKGVIVPPCKVGQTVYVDVDTLPYSYLHPLEIDGKFVKCGVLTIIIGKTQIYMKMAALYPSRYCKRDYLKYPISAIGKTVFFTRDEAEKALTERREG